MAAKASEGRTRNRESQKEPAAIARAMKRNADQEDTGAVAVDFDAMFG